MVSTNYEENVKMGDFSMQSYKILFVDDDEKLLALLVEYFTQEQFVVYTARNGNEALAQIKGTRPDILVLDVMLPGQSGLDICRQIRQHTEFHSLPIIMLTARVDEPARFVGLEMGADDYLGKPFSMRELGARIRAVLRRTHLDMAVPAISPGVLNFGALSLSIQEHMLKKAGQQVELTPTEFAILQLFMEHPRQVFSRLQLMEASRGFAFEGYERTIDAHIRNLRRKLDEGSSSCIETVYGIGYRFRGDVS